MPCVALAFGNAARSSSCTAGLTGAPPKPTFSTHERSCFASSGWRAMRGPIEPSAANALTRSFAISRISSASSKRPDRITSLPPSASCSAIVA
jgi:hypothetical protein